MGIFSSIVMLTRQGSKLSCSNKFLFLFVIEQGGPSVPGKLGSLFPYRRDVRRASLKSPKSETHSMRLYVIGFNVGQRYIFDLLFTFRIAGTISKPVRISNNLFILVFFFADVRAYMPPRVDIFFA